MARLYELEGTRLMEKALKGIGVRAPVVMARAVNKASPELVSVIKARMKQTYKRNTAVADSMRATHARLNNYGVFSAVTPDGVDDYGVRTGEILAYLEYGTSNMDPRPVLEDAVALAEHGCIQIMEDVINEELLGDAE